MTLWTLIRRAFAFRPPRDSFGREMPSWVVIYDDGARSHPLRRDDAEARARLFGGVRIVYARDDDGNLVDNPAGIDTDSTSPSATR